MLRDGEPGAPDVTLSPWRAWYSHRVEIDAHAAGGSEAVLDTLLVLVGTA